MKIFQLPIYRLWKKLLPATAIAGIVILLVPFVIFAQTGACDGKYCNPLGSVTDLKELIQTIIKQLLIVTIPLAGLGIIIAGLNYILAAVSGNPSRATKAKNIFTYVIIGCFLVIGALAVASAVINFLKTLT